MDAMLCSVQTDAQESPAGRSRSLRVRLGVVGATAIVIEDYLPQKFPKQSGTLIPPAHRGRIIPFPVLDKQLSSNALSLAWPRVFDFGTSKQAQVHFRFMGGAALKSSKAPGLATSGRGCL